MRNAECEKRGINDDWWMREGCVVLGEVVECWLSCRGGMAREVHN